MKYFFVFIQLSTIVFILLTGPVIASTIPGILFEAAGIILGIAAIYYMRPGNFNITPVPKDEGQFVETGPYSYIRHPMYLAQLVVLAPLVMEDYSWWRLLVWGILLINLVFKLNFEEMLLEKHFTEYKAYQKRTKRLIPFIY